MSRLIDARQQHARRRSPSVLTARTLLDQLTPRQQLVLERMSRPGARGRCHRVAADLGISGATVRNHLSAAYDRLGVDSLGEAVRLVGSAFENRREHM